MTTRGNIQTLHKDDSYHFGGVSFETYPVPVYLTHIYHKWGFLVSSRLCSCQGFCLEIKSIISHPVTEMNEQTSSRADLLFCLARRVFFNIFFLGITCSMAHHTYHSHSIYPSIFLRIWLVNTPTIIEHTFKLIAHNPLPPSPPRL